jgi:hypothetical protein
MTNHDRLKARLAIHDNTVPNVFTTSTESQSATESKVVRLCQEFLDKLEIQPELRLDVRKHITYVSKGLSSLGPAYESLDASRLVLPMILSLKFKLQIPFLGRG